MKIDRLLDLELLKSMREQGYVVERLHDEYPYAILNYTDKAQIEGVWNEVTTQCRGLIYNYETDEIVARPFKKFFNYGQAEAAEIKPGEPAFVMDKMDGSLGILYATPEGGIAVATRGSFHSEQAEWATEWINSDRLPDEIRERLKRWMYVFTDLVEIIYPENRIVVDYGARAELVYLASVEGESGEVFRFSGALPASASTFGGSLADALALEPRDNAEGLVVMAMDGRAVKIKQEDYLRKHKIRFDLTPMRVWENLMGSLDEFLGGIPDEFHDAVTEEWNRQAGYLIGVARLIVLSFDAVAEEVGTEDRKAFAIYAREHFTTITPALFALLDDDEDRAATFVHKMVKPEGPEAHTLLA